MPDIRDGENMELELHCVRLQNGGEAAVTGKPERSGKGVIYPVKVSGRDMLLKWYTNPPEDDFYENISNIIRNGAPSSQFIWPEYLTEKESDGSWGFVIGLPPHGFYDLGSFLLGRAKLSSFSKMLSAAMNLCNCFKQMHGEEGFCFSNLNDGSVLINPESGEVLISGGDNIVPEGSPFGVMPEARYMAPEIVSGTAVAPNKYSDRFSLAVILFILFFASHPFEGAKAVSRPYLTPGDSKKLYGSEAVFIFDPANDSNRPVRGIHQNVIRSWPSFPKVLKGTFIQEFGQNMLKTPQGRMSVRSWEDKIRETRDGLILCPNCGREMFADTAYGPTNCPSCAKPVDISKVLVMQDRRTVPLVLGKKIYFEGNVPEAEVVKDQEGNLLIRNLSSEPWYVETRSGKTKVVRTQGFMPVIEGLRITFKTNDTAVISKNY